MAKRDLLLIIGAMACFASALACLVYLQMQASARTETNVQAICQRLEDIDGLPCDLIQPSEAETRLFGSIPRE